VNKNRGSAVRDLSWEEQVGMSHRSFKKHDIAIIILHWFNALSWILLLVTGLALFSGNSLSITPDAYNIFMAEIFRGKANLLKFHIFWGTLWASIIAFYLFFGFRSHVLAVRDMILLDKDDIRWMMIKPLKILGLSKAELPPQGAYNAGQKLFGWIVFSMIPLIIASGLIMGFSLFDPLLIRWAILIHGVTVSMVVAGVIVHIYMAAVLPEEKPAFFSMVTGRINAYFAYHHHRKFWQKRVTQEYIWNRNNHKDITQNQNLIRFSSGVNEDFERLADDYEQESARLALRKPYLNPYVGGAFLGLVLLMAFFLTGQGLGGSGGLARIEAWIFDIAAPTWTANHSYWGKYVANGKNPLISSAVLLTLGVFMGGWVSGHLSRRVGLKMEKGKNISNRQRAFYALLGGFLVGFAARLARGCTSGLALTGGASMAVAGWVFFMMFFVGGFITAYFVRRIWL